MIQAEVVMMNIRHIKPPQYINTIVVTISLVAPMVVSSVTTIAQCWEYEAAIVIFVGVSMM